MFALKDSLHGRVVAVGPTVLPRRPYRARDPDRYGEGTEIQRQLTVTKTNTTILVRTQV